MNAKFFAPTLSLALAALLGVLVSPLARAQQTTQAAAGGADLSEVIVTARRVEERAQDVPISMTIFNQRQLTDRRIVTSGDLAAATPGLSVDSEFGQDVTSFAIRGFVQQLNTTPSVAVYFADAVVPRGGAVGEPAGSGVAPGSFFDLQNVQVLKGPQGTLFGRNTDGGAVLLVPQKPTSDFEGYVEGSVGNYDMANIQGVINLPFGDKIRLRLSVNDETRKGYENNIATGIGPSDFENIDFTAARLGIVVDITPNLENYLTYAYNLSVNAGLLPQLYACNPANAGTYAGLCEPSLQLLQGKGNYAVINDLPGAKSYLRQNQWINTTTWHATDNFTVKNIANYGELITALDSSLFGGFLLGPYPVVGYIPFIASSSIPDAIGGKTTDQYTWTDELELSGNLFDNKLTWQGGGYLEHSGPLGDLTGTRSPNFLICSATDPTYQTCSGEGEEDVNTSILHYSDWALFGQATWAIIDQLKVTGGVRYTSDHTTATIHQTDYVGWPPTTPGPYTPFPPNPLFPPGNPFCQVFAPGVTYATGCTQNLTQDSHAPTWLVDLDYNPIQDMLLYAKYARGYRQGSIAPFALYGFQIYDPEHVNSYEIGEKTTFSGPVPGTFDVTAHYNNFTDQQLLAGFISAGVPSAGIANAGKSKIWGIEVESTITPFKPLTLGLSYSYLHTELETAFVASPPPGAIISFPATLGGELPFSPKNKGAAFATYRFETPDDIGSVSLGANYTYTSSLLVTAADPTATLKGYGLLGMNLHWDSIFRSSVDGEIFATNLTNRLYYNNNTQLYDTPLDIAARYPGEPRMYGVRVRIRFGGK
ncbi:MAG TPA: TonB-dependent receptor [Steroidobacteraceae bacterium]|nr:TonB-dependent receptor [Steroidobacteraceae bacterium]